MKLILTAFLTSILVSAGTYFLSPVEKEVLNETEKVVCKKGQSSNQNFEKVLKKVSLEKTPLHKIKIKLKKDLSPCPELETNKYFLNQELYKEQEVNQSFVIPSEILLALEFKDEQLEIDYSELSEDEIESEKQRSENLKKGIDEFNKALPRFKIYDNAPNGFHYFGIHIDEYKDIETFLGNKECKNPTLSMANNPMSYLGIFFQIMEARQYKGRVYIINDAVDTPIMAIFGLREMDQNPRPKRIPHGYFGMFVHEDVHRDYKGFMYQYSDIRQRHHHFYGGDSPWLYNSCSKAIATVSNSCSLDTSMDMQYSDFIYLANEDLLIGNIYCKKSHQTSWKRMANFELLRSR